MERLLFANGAAYERLNESYLPVVSDTPLLKPWYEQDADSLKNIEVTLKLIMDTYKFIRERCVEVASDVLDMCETSGVCVKVQTVLQSELLQHIPVIPINCDVNDRVATVYSLVPHTQSKSESSFLVEDKSSVYYPYTLASLYKETPLEEVLVSKENKCPLFFSFVKVLSEPTSWEEQFKKGLETYCTAVKDKSFTDVNMLIGAFTKHVVPELVNYRNRLLEYRNGRD